MTEPTETAVRTEVVKGIIDSETPFETISACRDLTNNELEFIRVYLAMNAPTPRAPRKDRGTKRGPKGDQRSIAELSRGGSAAQGTA